jgi:hypothetical protein
MPVDNALPAVLPMRLPSVQPGSVPGGALLDDAGLPLLDDAS